MLNRLVYYFTVSASFMTAAAFAFFFTPAVKHFAFLIGAVDIPKDNRRMHSEPTARLGGLAIFIGFIISLVFFIASTRLINLSSQIIGIIIGASIIIGLGIVDDIMALKALVKLFIQIIAALIPALCGVRIDVLTNFNILSNDSYVKLAWVSIPITILWIVGITNAVNLIDGIDGLAAGTSTISSVSITIIMLLIGNVEMAIVCACLAGACAGFMPFNLNPAKIFMGDTGATFLGFIMAVVTIQGMFRSYLIVSFAVPFLVLGLPIFDTVFAAFRRISEGRSPFSPDKMHIHHLLTNLGLNQKQTVLVLYTVSISLATCGIVITTMGRGKAVIFALIAILALISIVLIISNKKILAYLTKILKGKNNI